MLLPECDAKARGRYSAEQHFPLTATLWKGNQCPRAKSFMPGILTPPRFVRVRHTNPGVSKSWPQTNLYGECDSRLKLWENIFPGASFSREHIFRGINLCRASSFRPGFDTPPGLYV